jgi:hypothetical protein
VHDLRDVCQVIEWRRVPALAVRVRSACAGLGDELQGAIDDWRAVVGAVLQCRRRRAR